jgi:hydrogenase maturation protease
VKVLVAGIGNLFLGDDGFGVEVVGRLARRPMPEGVLVADFGIRGVHLAFELLGGYDALVLVDAVPLEEAPGTIAVIEADLSDLAPADDDLEPALDAHSMSPALVLRTLAGLGGTVDRVVVIGCQPAVLTEGIGLSEPVAAAAEAALDVVDAVVHELCVREEEESRT